MLILENCVAVNQETERADLGDWRPRRFWRMLGRWQDRAHGYYAGAPSLEYRIEMLMRRAFPPAWAPGDSEGDSEEVWKPTLTDIRRAAQAIAGTIR